MILVLRWLLFSLVITFSGWLISGVHVQDYRSAMFFVFILGLINAFIKPFLILITLPVNVLTLGLFTFIINTALLLLAANFSKGVTFDGFLPAFLASLLLTIFGGMIFKIQET